MTFLPVTMWRIRCDDCGEIYPDSSIEVYAWLDQAYVLDCILDAGWQVTDDGRHFCEEHRVDEDE